MFKQTTCLSFEKYGTILTDLPNDIIICEKKSSLDLLNKSVNNLYFSNTDLHIKLRGGVVLILVSNDSNFDNIESFILNSKIKLKKVFIITLYLYLIIVVLIYLEKIHF
ncbi:hypothetical protein H8697_00575 [[Eubacterium] tenue]|nr:hypothetical protein [[Eubacterium] tenue]MBC8630206.1 hypothetical protein [[Eubacterium] tenue]